MVAANNVVMFCVNHNHRAGKDVMQALVMCFECLIEFGLEITNMRTLMSYNMVFITLTHLVDDVTHEKQVTQVTIFM